MPLCAGYAKSQIPGKQMISALTSPYITRCARRYVSLQGYPILFRFQVIPLYRIVGNTLVNIVDKLGVVSDIRNFAMDKQSFQHKIKSDLRQIFSTQINIKKYLTLLYMHTAQAAGLFVLIIMPTYRAKSSTNSSQWHEANRVLCTKILCTGPYFWLNNS